MIPKDMKIGLLLGLVLVTIAMLWLATGHGLILKTTSPESRSITQQEGSAALNNLSTNKSAQTGEVSEIDNPSKQPDLTIYEQAEKIQTKKFHIINKGETLSDISRTYYGSANKWRKILNANREIIKDVNKLRPGTKIIIPD
jgi:nucleoid-associated protein YgaU